MTKSQSLLELLEDIFSSFPEDMTDGRTYQSLRDFRAHQKMQWKHAKIQQKYDKKIQRMQNRVPLLHKVGGTFGSVVRSNASYVVRGALKRKLLR